MKMNNIHLLPALLLGMLSTLSAAVTGDSLNIGTSNVLTGTTTSTLGYHNTLYSNYSLAVGYYNATSVLATSSLLMGTSNSFTGALTDTLVIGYLNGASGGNANAQSLVVGYANSTALDSGLVAGKYNVATKNNFALGKGLTANTVDPIVVLGRYNATPVAGQVLVVGVGTGAGSGAKNGFEVYSDGTVKMPKRQGDLKMGIFGPAGADN
jgi:hypothetical protein